MAGGFPPAAPARASLSDDSFERLSRSSSEPLALSAQPPFPPLAPPAVSPPAHCIAAASRPPLPAPPAPDPEAPRFVDLRPNGALKPSLAHALPADVKASISACGLGIPSRVDTTALDALAELLPALTSHLEACPAGALLLPHVRRLLSKVAALSGPLVLPAQRASNLCAAEEAARAWLAHEPLASAADRAGISADLAAARRRADALGIETRAALSADGRIELARQLSAAAEPAERANIQRRLDALLVVDRSARAVSAGHPAHGGAGARPSDAPSLHAAHEEGRAAVRAVFPSATRDKADGKPHAMGGEMWQFSPHRRALVSLGLPLIGVIPPPLTADSAEALNCRRTDTERYHAAALAQLPPHLHELVILPTSWPLAARFDARGAYLAHVAAPCDKCETLPVSCEAGAMLTALSQSSIPWFDAAAFERRRASAAKHPPLVYKPATAADAVAGININLEDIAQGRLKALSPEEAARMHAEGLFSPSFVVNRFGISAAKLAASPGATIFDKSFNLGRSIVARAHASAADEGIKLNDRHLAAAGITESLDSSPRNVQHVKLPNEHCMYQPFRMTNLYETFSNFTPGGFGFLADVKKGFPSVMMSHLIWLLFASLLAGLPFARVRLAMGYLLAPAIFSTLTAEGVRTVLRTLLRDHPFAFSRDWCSLLCYIDDFIGAARTLEAAQALYKALQNWMRSAGLVESLAKFQIGQVLRVLGVMIDLKLCTASVPADKAAGILVLTAVIQICITDGDSAATGPLMRKVTGKLGAVCAVIPAGRLHMGALYGASDAFDALAPVDAAPSAAAPACEPILAELAWFADKLADPSSLVRLAPYGASASAAALVQARSDASKHDVGGGFGGHLGQLVLWGRYHADSELGIAPREATCPAIVAALFGHWFSGLTVVWATDSTSVFVAVSRGRASTSLAPSIDASVALLHNAGADFYAVWLPREANTYADQLGDAETPAAAISIMRAWRARALA